TLSLSLHPYFMLLPSASSSHHRHLHSSPHDALPIYLNVEPVHSPDVPGLRVVPKPVIQADPALKVRHQIVVRDLEAIHGQPWDRSEEHTSELQSRENLVCRLLLEKKKKRGTNNAIFI